MPRFASPSVRKHLRRTLPLLALPVLALTATASQAETAGGETAGGEAAAASPSAAADAAAVPAADRRAAVTYAIDATHSELQFRIRHLVSRVSGGFKTWAGSITVEDPARWETAVIDVQIQTASIDTKNDRRDEHLRSDDFFAAAQHPTISFRSTSIERRGDSARILGNLTMRGVTKPVVLVGEFLGTTKGANGKARIGFDATTTVNRLDYGIAYNRAVEAGGMLLGDEVTITIAVAAVEP